MHCRDRLVRARRPEQPFHDKKRVPGPVYRVTVRARQRTGCRGRWVERPPDAASI